MHLCKKHLDGLLSVCAYVLFRFLFVFCFPHFRTYQALPIWVGVCCTVHPSQQFQCGKTRGSTHSLGPLDFALVPCAPCVCTRSRDRERRAEGEIKRCERASGRERERGGGRGGEREKGELQLVFFTLQFLNSKSKTLTLALRPSRAMVQSEWGRGGHTHLLSTE